MENEFNNIIALLEKINTHNANNIVPSAELDKEYKRIKDLDVLNKTCMENLNLLKKFYSSSVDEIMGQICFFNVELGIYFWHMENIKDITEKFTTKDKNGK